MVPPTGSSAGDRRPRRSREVDDHAFVGRARAEVQSDLPVPEHRPLRIDLLARAPHRELGAVPRRAHAEIVGRRDVRDVDVGRVTDQLEANTHRHDCHRPRVRGEAGIRRIGARVARVGACGPGHAAQERFHLRRPRDVDDGRSGRRIPSRQPQWCHSPPSSHCTPSPRRGADSTDREAAARWVMSTDGEPIKTGHARTFAR